MTQAIYALQEAIYQELSGDTTFLALVPSIFQHVPEETAFPYAVIVPQGTEDWSTSTKEGQQAEISVRVYMREAGSKKALEAAERVRVLLHEAPLTVTGFVLVSLRVEETDITLGADGLTYQSAIRLQALMQEA